MKRRYIVSLILAAASMLTVGIALATQHKFSVKSPNGLAFSEFRGYERWQMIAPSLSDTGAGCGTSQDPGCIKAVLGNPAAIKAYENGIPFNGKKVPDGVVYVKIEWEKATDTTAGYPMAVSGKLAEVAFMVKDSKRFPKTDGWGYATFQYNASADTWKAKGDSPDFAAGACHGCHTLVKANDFVFTHYPKR